MTHHYYYYLVHPDCRGQRTPCDNQVSGSIILPVGSVYQVLGFAIHLLGLKWFVKVYVTL